MRRSRRSLVRIAPGSSTKKGLTTIIVLFDESMNPGSAQATANYHLFAGVKKKKHTVYTKFVGIRKVMYVDSSHTATITLSKPFKGLLQVTALSGILGVNGTSTISPLMIIV